MSTASERNPPLAGNVESNVRQILADVLSLAPEIVAGIAKDSPLFGAIPELDSMAVAGLLTELEDRLDIIIDDDEIDTEIFDTFGALVDFAARKVAG